MSNLECRDKPYREAVITYSRNCGDLLFTTVPLYYISEHTKPKKKLLKKKGRITDKPTITLNMSDGGLKSIKKKMDK